MVLVWLTVRPSSNNLEICPVDATDHWLLVNDIAEDVAYENALTRRVGTIRSVDVQGWDTLDEEIEGLTFFSLIFVAELSA